MTFFSGASNVQIYGGEFNQVKGNMTVFDQSRHTSHINAYNTSNTVMENMNNDNSQKYRGTRPPDLPGRRSTHDRQRSESDRLPNAAEYFHQPTMHPMLAMHLYNTASTSDSRDSFNTTNTTARDIENDNSVVYEGKRRRRRRSGGRRHSDIRREDDADYDEPVDCEEELLSSASSTPSIQSKRRSRRPSPYQGQSPSQGIPPSTAIASQPHNPITTPFFNGHRPGTHAIADYRPGDIVSMPPGMQAPFAQLMQSMVQQLTSPAAPQGQGQAQPPTQEAGAGTNEDPINIEEPDYDSGEESEDEEEQERDKRMRDPSIAAGMANLTLNDELRPAFSQIKSSPNLPLAGTQGNAPIQSLYAEPRNAESTQDLPAHIRYPFVASQPPPQNHAPYNPQQYPYQSFPSAVTAPTSNVNPAVAYNNPGTAFIGYGENHRRTPVSPTGTAPAPAPNHSPNSPPAQAPGSPPFFPGDNGVPAAFGIQPSFIQDTNPVGRGPIFNNIEGNYNKTDNTVKNNFIASGNTTNTLLQNMFNDNSIRAPVPKASEGKRRRK